MDEPATSNAPALRAALIRNFDTAPMKRLQREPRYDALSARLAVGTAARALGMSIDIVAPGKCSCPYHFHHAQEEAFVILEGRGTLRVAGEMLAITAGDTIFIPPGPMYPHQILNTSEAPLKYLSISTREALEVCEYPDSRKYLATVRGADGTECFASLRSEGEDLDYWDGEP